MTPEIIASLRGFVDRALALLATVDPKSLRPKIKQQIEITDANSATMHEEVEPDYLILHIHLMQALEQGESFEAFKGQLENDPIIGQQMNTLVGTVEGARRLSADELLRQFIGLYFWGTKYDKVFRQEVFDSVCERVSHSFSATSVTLAYQTILENFKMAPKATLQVAPGLVLRGLEASEVERLWNENVTLQERYPFGGLGGHVFSISAVLETTRQTPKIVGAQTGTPANPAKLPSNEVRVDFDRVISALHLLKPGGVRIGMVFKKSDMLWDVGGAFWSGASVPDLHFPKYEFDSINDSESLQSLYASLQHAEQQHRQKQIGALLLGVRRIGFSCDRTLDEDKLLDTMIALEAMVLNTAGAAQERGELRFRLALYVAKLVGGTTEDANRQYKLVQKAYKLRSKVVHGEGFKDLERDTVQEVAETARLVGRTLLGMHERNEQVDWDKLLGLKE